jgi:D-alanyl-D-alanine carboxypeptidase
MKKLLILTVLSICSWQVTDAQLNGAYIQRLDDVFDSVCNRFNLKGATAAIVVPGQGIWERAHGISHPGTPITKDMYMGIGSNTKTYFAVLMLRLQEQGKLDLDDTIGQWIQHQHVPGNITIRQLLNHTSGLYSYTSNPDINNYILSDFTKIWPPDSVLNLVKAPVAAPGGAWDYCNTNYLLAGLIIRSVTGKTMQQALRDEILTPQGLSETYLFPQETPPGVIPHSWSANLSGNGTHEDLVAVHSYSHNAMFSLASSAGAIMATAKDNALFWDKLMSGQILNSGSMAEFETLVSVSLGQGYGLGVFKLNSFNGRPIVSHGGTNIGFINDNIHDKTSGVSIVMLTNQDSISNNILLGGCIAALHKTTIQYTDTRDIIYRHDDIYVWPNPARDELFVDIIDEEFAQEAVIYDMLGRTVLVNELQSGVNKLGLSNINSGTYILNIIGAGKTVYRQKIQVVK